MRRLIFYIFYLLSRSPFISVTLDKSFHNISRNTFNYEELRYSIFSFGVGIYKIYIVTYKKREGLKALKILSLNDVIKMPSDTEISEKIRRYREHIVQKNSNEIEIEIDFLKYKVADEESTKNTATSKVNNYTAILLVLIPLIFASGLKFVLDIKNKLLIIVAFVILYSIANIIGYIFDFYKVKNFSRSTFGDLKDSTNHQTKLAESYYEDWYCIKEEAMMFVTYVLNIERYMKITILFMVIFIIVSNFNTTSKTAAVGSTIVKEPELNYTVDVTLTDAGEIQTSNLNKLLDIQNRLLKRQVKQVIIIKNDYKDELIKSRYQDIINMLRTYNVDKVDIIEINQNIGDNSLKESEFIKILILGGKK